MFGAATRLRRMAAPSHMPMSMLNFPCKRTPRNHAAAMLTVDGQLYKCRVCLVRCRDECNPMIFSGPLQAWRQQWVSGETGCRIG
jgi:hypothetical protein